MALLNCMRFCICPARLVPPELLLYNTKGELLLKVDDVVLKGLGGVGVGSATTTTAGLPQTFLEFYWGFFL